MSDAAEWFYARGGQQQGPVTLEALRAMAAAGQLAAADLVWRNGTPDWKPAGEVPDIFPDGAPAAVAAQAVAAPGEAEAAALAAPTFSPGFPTEGTPTVAPSGQAVYGGPRMDPGWASNADASEGEIPIPSYLLQGVLCTLFCFLPFGIMAIIYGAMVGSKISAGDFEGARAASDKARTWVRFSVWLGLLTSAALAYAMFSGAMGGGGGRITRISIE